MKDFETKKNVLQEIMDLMDGRDGERLKSHPKVAAKFAPKAEVEPKLSLEESETEMPAMEEESEAEPLEEKTEGELSPEDIQMLLEKLEEMK